MSQQDIRETFVASQPIFDGKVIKVETWKVRLTDGRPAQRGGAACGAAAVVPVDERGAYYAGGSTAWSSMKLPGNPAGKLTSRRGSLGAPSVN